MTGAARETTDTRDHQQRPAGPPGVAPGPGGFREYVAAQLRAEAARQKISARALAERVGESRQWAGRRLNGDTAADTDDLERLAAAMGTTIEVLVLDPARRADAAPPSGDVEATVPIPLPRRGGPRPGRHHR